MRELVLPRQEKHEFAGSAATSGQALQDRGTPESDLATAKVVEDPARCSFRPLAVFPFPNIDFPEDAKALMVYWAGKHPL